MTTARFLVPSEALTGTRAVLTGAELHHLRVRRLRIGSELILCDGGGQERSGIVVALDRQRAVVALSAEQPAQHESPLHLVLAQALLKADKLDWVIEKATELGVSELLLFTCERAVSRPSATRQARWHRIARSAAKQCQRSTVPAVIGPVPFEHLLSNPSDAARLFFWEQCPPGGLAAARAAAPGTSLLAVVGPEGGFSPAEADGAAGAGFQLIGLAPRILRAETAAIVAITLCQFLWGDLAGTQQE